MRLPLFRTVKCWWQKQTYKSKGWVFSSFRRDVYIFEYAEWLEHYLPISVKGLVVLDVGAGEGETARFYLEHGAKKVICIEPDAPSFRLLLKNSVGRPMVCFNKKFEVSDLEMEFDFMKMDIEGYEELLLTASFNKPCVIEVHGLQLREKFEKLGYVIRNKTDEKHRDFSCASYATCVVQRHDLNKT